MIVDLWSLGEKDELMWMEQRDQIGAPASTYLQQPITLLAVRCSFHTTRNKLS